MAIVIILSLANCIFLLGLENTCRRKEWTQLKAVLASGAVPRPSFTNGLDDFLGPNRKLQSAADNYLRGYLFSLPGRDSLSLARVCEMKGDNLVGEDRFASCMNLLNTRASLFQYVLRLPYLAEACQRCVVSQCRRHTQQLGQDIRLDPKQYDKASRKKLELAYILLAEQTDNLADLFTQHGKFEIAERAYQDAIVSAAIADHIEAESTAGLINLKFEPGHHKPCRLQRFYLAYAAFLSQIDRQEDALALFSRMSEMCGQ